MDSQIRISSGGKIKPYIAHALEFFQKNDDKPLVLHTLPPSAPEQRDTLSPATTTIPRLITVVEIIKREYLKILDLNHSARLAGLHQYNQIGSLEEVFKISPPKESDLRQILDAKHYPKQKQTPYMKITLSLIELPDLIANGATYQAPLIRKLSKGAKNRAKKRKRKEDAQKTTPQGSDNQQ